MLQPSFDYPGRFYTFYYDESNNARKLSINEHEDSYNVDNDENQVAKANFMLAGVMHKGTTNTADLSALFASLHLQRSAKELKFNQLAWGTFDKVLKSQRIRTLLQWVLESDLYLHYFNLNIEYWSFIDIIDDCVLHCQNQGELTFPDVGLYRYYLDYHKDALYRVIRARKAEFIAMAKHHGYPAIEGKERAFVEAVKDLVSEHLKQLRGQQPAAELEDVSPFQSLVELLDLCSGIDDMTLTLGTEESLLIDGFSEFYHHRAVSFPNSEHIFDEEDEVESEIETLADYDELPKIRCRFVDSELTPLTQVSDALAGLYGSYFDFIEKNTYEDLATLEARLNPLQRQNLALMKALIEKTHDECPQMLFYVMTLSEHDKHRMFLFPEEV